MQMCSMFTPTESASVIPTAPCTLLEHSLHAQHFPRLTSEGFSFILLKQKQNSH